MDGSGICVTCGADDQLDEKGTCSGCSEGKCPGCSDSNCPGCGTEASSADEPESEPGEENKI